MAVIPKKIADRITFCENHIATFLANATAIGTTSSAVTALQTKTVAARAAFNAKGVADDAARDATNDLKQALTAMTDAVSTIIKQVKVQAEITGDSVYSLASIPVPATPGPVAAPGKPTDFEATLEEDGSVNLAWKCPNPAGSSGTSYQVYRRTTPTGEFTGIGVTGVREFVDATIPAGSSQVTYMVRGWRSTAAGPWATYNVTFGVGGGTTVTSAITEPSPKLAA